MIPPRVALLLLLLLGTSSAAAEPDPVPAGGAAAPPERAEPLTLERAVSMALERNERAQIASEQAEVARARLQRARAFFFPELSSTAAYSRRPYETVRTIGTQTVTLQSQDALSGVAVLRWTAFDARGYPLYRQAKRERGAAELEAEEAKRLLAFEAADAFLLTLSAEQVVEAASRRLEFARRNLSDARARLEAKLVSVNDLTRAELELATAERESTRAASATEAAYVNLGLLLDSKLAPPLSPPESLFEEASRKLPDVEALVARAEQARPDVLASFERAAAAAEAASEPWRRAIPSLSLLGQVRASNETGFTGRAVDGFGGVELSWSLFDGGERYGEARERAALSRIAALSARARQRKAGAEVRTALVALTSAQSSLRHATVAAAVARRNAAETAELYRQGLTGALEVADASLRMFEAEVAQARERYGLGLSFLDLRAAIGAGPLEALAEGASP